MYPRGKDAYEAYCDLSEWESLASGGVMPKWHKLPPAIQDAWAHVEAAITNKVLAERDGEP